MAEELDPTKLVAGKLFTRSQAIAALVGRPKDTDRGKDVILSEADAQKVEIDGRRQYFSLQNIWSITIIIWISALLLFNCSLVTLIGAGILHFAETPWLITTFVTELFLQVIGLGYIAARFLFPGSGKLEKPKKAKRKAKAASAQKALDRPLG